VLVIGLTGGIGAGKTETTHVLRELGVMVIESDRVAHLSYRPGTQAFTAIVNRFGKDVLDDSGVIDRKTLGNIVFSDPARREELEAIVWPAAKEWIENRLIEEENRGTAVVVIEVPKLYEAGWDQFVDAVWTVEAPKSEIDRRVEQSSGLGRSEISARVAAQLSREERSGKADVVIENDSTLDDLQERVRNAWETTPGKSDKNPK
jgi:dephospho-CoA kinase